MKWLIAYWGAAALMAGMAHVGYLHWSLGILLAFPLYCKHQEAKKEGDA